MKEKITSLYSELENFNGNINQPKKRGLYKIPIPSHRIKYYDNILFQSKNNSYRIKNEKELNKSKSIFDYKNDDLIYNRKNHINQNFKKIYNELKSFTNDFNPNSFDLPSKESNLKRNKSSYFNVLGSIQNYKNDKKMSKKDTLTKEIMSELGNGIKYKTINNNNLLRIRSYSSFFEPKKKKKMNLLVYKELILFNYFFNF